MVAQVQDKEDIMERVLGASARLSELGVISLGLFGSFIRDEQHASSDVDMLVEFAEDKHSFDNFMDVCFLLEDILGRRVEVVTPESLSPHFSSQVLRKVQRVSLAA